MILKGFSVFVGSKMLLITYGSKANSDLRTESDDEWQKAMDELR
jgi:hypothetical protein